MEPSENDRLLPSIAAPPAVRFGSISPLTDRASIQERSFGDSDESASLENKSLHGNDSGGSSWYASVFLVVNAGLGAGLLNFPAAFNQSGGIWVAVGIQAALLVFIVLAFVVLLYCSDLHHCATYQDVVYAMCGRKTQLVCAATVAVYCFGTCITFFIIIADQWDKFLTFAYGSDFCHHWYMSRQFTLVVSSLLLVLPLCFPKRIDFLKYASALGVLIVVYVVLLVTVKYFVGPVNPGPIKTRPTTWTDAFGVVPVICFSYQCHLSVVPIYSCLRKRTLPEFSKTLTVAMAICVFSYSATASFGYLSFGSDVAEDVLESYEPTADVLVAVIGIAGKMYTTYPILLFVGRSSLDNIYTHVRGYTPESIAAGETRRRVTMTIVFFSSSLLLAILVPNIGVVIAVLGGLAALFIFTFPGLCLLRLVLRDTGHLSRPRYYLGLTVSTGFLIIGAFLFGVTTAQAILSHIGGHSQPSASILCH